MVCACTLICCEPGRVAEVVRAVQRFTEVKLAHSVLGRWDVVTEIEVEDLAALSNVILKIHGVYGVRCTETLIEMSV